MGSDSNRGGWRRHPLTPGAATPPGAPAQGALDPANAYLEQLGPGSRRTMREALDKLATLASDGRCGRHDLPWHLLRLEHTAALRIRLASTLAPATANKHMAALRGVLRQCARQGLLTPEALHGITDLPPIRGVAPRASVVLSAGEFERIAQTCIADDSPAGARDHALLSLLRTSNLRRAEAVALDVADFDPGTGRLQVGPRDRESSRQIDLAAPVREALAGWLALRGRTAGPLFNPVNKGGRIESRRLSEQAIYIACQKRSSAAGLPALSPEDLRRAPATA